MTAPSDLYEALVIIKSRYMRNPNEATNPNKRPKSRTQRKQVPATSLLQIETAAPVTRLAGRKKGRS